MADLGLAAAFTFGMVATVNPCALPMLPAYLGWFITGDEATRPTPVAVTRAVVVALAVSAGFVAVFGTLGALVTAASAEVERITPWVTPVVGLALVAMGVVLLAGRAIRLPLPRLDRTGGGRGLAAMFLYGVSYAVVSVSCSIQLFVAHVATTFGADWGTGLARLGAFAAGFTLVIVALSMAVAVARGSAAALVRRASPHVGRASGLLFVLTGAYLVWYGASELRSGASPSDPVTDRVWGWSFDISAWVQSIGGVEVGLALALVVAAIALVLVLRSTRRAPR
ncbi:MAG TPA: cytochrome c biogenesis protein CcdA [Acidimicrobiales bacterium]|nr:cytochrome c biogenesis protein CcdA [Acidimicrobiales bacterium]